jgi:hypothetical protein
MEFDFTTNQTVDALDTVPEKYRGLYAEIAEGENAGKFGIIAGAAGLVSDYTGMARSAAGLRQEKKAASDESAQRRVALSSITDAVTSLGVEVGDEGVVPAIEAYITELQDKVKGGAQMKIDLDKIKGQFDKQLTDGLAVKDTELEGMLGALRKYMVTGAANGALAKHKGSVDLLLPHVQAQCDMVKDDNGDYVVRVKDPDGTYRINASGAFMGVDDLVVEMKTKEAFQRAFESESPGGTGSPPGGMRRQPQKPANTELSATDKIRIGLQKGQHQQSGRA